ncbi:MAG TPA: hypothetical protein VFX97_11755 [Pyrinomonadaceae bacterium]|nr:hypothetical protein [Pyrinomonadaceae bacterium]
MNNKKCHYCGFINFVSAEACRKCEAVLSETAEQSAYDSAPTYRGGVNSYNQPYPAKSRFTLGKACACVLGLSVAVIIYTFGMGVIRGHAKVNWIEFRPDGQTFTIAMPNEPIREKMDLPPIPNGKISAHVFISEVQGQGVAGFCYADYSGVELSDTAYVLDGALNGLVTRSNSTLLSKNPTNYQGMPGLDFELTPPESAGVKNGRGFGRLLISGNRLYMFFITASEGSDLLAGKDKFLNPQIPPRPPVWRLDPATLPSPQNFYKPPVYEPGPGDLK